MPQRDLPGLCPDASAIPAGAIAVYRCPLPIYLCAPQQDRFLLEQLEPRMLLSAGLLNIAPGSPIDSGGSAPPGVAVGDFNGDGNPDIVVANQTDKNYAANSGTLSVLLSNSDGTFRQPPGGPMVIGGNADFVVVGHFDSNRSLDLAVSDANSHTVRILLGNGNGTFATAPSSPIQVGDTSYPFHLVTGDFNGDGKPDLAVSSDSGNTGVYVYLGAGDGTFAPGPVVDGGTGFVTDLQTGDFNADGKTDLVVNDGENGVVTVLLAGGDATGLTFKTLAVDRFTFSASNSLAVGRFDNNATDDIAVSSGNSVNILLGNGRGTFQSLASGPITPNSGLIVSLAAADLNGDGKTDLVIGLPNNTMPGSIPIRGPGAGGVGQETPSSNGDIGLLLGSGDGNFSEAPGTPFDDGGDYPFSLAIGDFNGDSKPDLAAADISSNSVGVLLQGSFLGVNNLNVGAQEGSKFTAALATFTSQDETVSTLNFSSTIDWGDGTSSAGVISETAGVFTVTGTHTYAERGNKTAVISISRDDGENIKVPTFAAVIAPIAVPDPSFGSSGTGAVVVPFTSNGVAAQPDGKPLIAGSAKSRKGNYSTFALARYNTNGSIDFNAAADFGSDAHATGVTVLPSGKILVAGIVLGRDNLQHLGVARFNANGSLDASFGGTGIETGPVVTLNGGSYTFHATQQADGKIVVADSLGTNFSVTRYLANMTPDAAFGTGGHVTTVFDTGTSEADVLLPMADGRLIAAGTSNHHAALVRYNTDGSLDSTFGIGGLVSTDIPGLTGITDLRNDLRPRYVGSLITLGYISDGGNAAPRPVLILYNANGSKNIHFADNGELIPPIAPGSSGPGAKHGAPGGKLVAIPDLALDQIGRIFQAAGTKLARLSGISPAVTKPKSSKSANRSAPAARFATAALPPVGADSSVLTGKLKRKRGLALEGD